LISKESTPTEKTHLGKREKASQGRQKGRQKTVVLSQDDNTSSDQLKKRKKGREEDMKAPYRSRRVLALRKLAKLGPSEKVAEQRCGGSLPVARGSRRGRTPGHGGIGQLV